MDTQNWNVVVVTTDGAEHVGRINRVGLMHHMLTDDGTGWLLVDAPDGQHALPASRVVSILIEEAASEDLDVAIDAAKGARR